MSASTLNVGFFAGLLSLAAFVPYIIAIVKGVTKPNRATWWIWTTNGLILLASYYASGAESTVWVAVGYLVGSLLTAVLALRYGEGGWSSFDRSCLLGATLGLLVWWVFHSPVITVVMGLSVDFAGALPTIRKAYHAPESEDRIAWILFISGNILNLFAIEAWSFAIAVYPVYMFLASGTIAALVLRPRPSTNRPSIQDGDVSV